MQGQVNTQIIKVGQNFGLQKGLITNLTKSQTVRVIFLSVIKDSGLQKAQKKVGNMLYSIATKLPQTISNYRQQLAKYVGNNDINNPNQLDYVIEYLKNKELKGGIIEEEFKKDCGIGIKLTNEQIQKIIDQNIIDANKDSKKFDYLAKIKDKIPYVEGKLLKDLFEQTWKGKGLPDKVAGDDKKKKQVKDNKQAVNKQIKTNTANNNVVQQQQQKFHIKDISQLIGREMKSALNSKSVLQMRNKQFGQIILTRFPPQPNGYLHIGHCKAMRFNFMQAKTSKGACYLRFDDTNPLKQNIEYIENIKQNITFMGYQPWKITHASDNFDQLYQFAIQLIKQGDAFVCAENIQIMRKKRNQGLPSEFRDRPIEENLKLFQEMRLGLHSEGSFSLRAKIDYKHPNTTLRDPVIYRIRFTSHPHVGDKWCVYPLYDYTHPLCDSLQGISHSLCSLQFQIRRQLYYWVLQKLDLYKPNVWQYSRLNITNTVLSKRKLHELIFTNRVNGWDDPRVLTINGMRRRGYPSEAINNFCDVIGVTRRGNQNYINFSVLELEVRKYLDIHAPRTMAVLEPVQMIIDGIQESEIIVPLFPKDQTKGNRKIKLTKKIYVQRSDIKIKDQKGFYGIAPNKIVGLKYASTFYIKDVVVENGVITRVLAQVDEKKSKANSYLNWISADETYDCDVNLFGLLFNVQKPGDMDNYLEHLNPESHKLLKGVKIHKSILEGITKESRFQFERKGYFCLDKDSDIEKGKLIWNQTVGLVDKNKK